MRTIQRGAVLAVALLGAASLAACSSETPASGGAGGSGKEVISVPVDGAELEGSPTYDAAKAAGKIVVGVKEDQPNLGYMDAVTGDRSGFDVDVASWIAQSLSFTPEQIEFVSVPSANREQALINGDINYYVGTYSITDKRKTQIDFAGPYFETGQGLLVLNSDDTIKSENDLVGKTVCSATGSTPIQNIRDNYPGVETMEFDTYSQCVEALKDGQVNVVTTDQAILIGYAALEPDALKVVGEPFSKELYGVGLPKGDDALRHFINKVFTEGGDTWQSLYDGTLGASGTKVAQPAVDDY